MAQILRRSSQLGACRRWWLEAVAGHPFSTDGASGSYTGSADRFFPHAPGRNHLFVPGPCNIPERVIRAMNRAAENHRDPHFPALSLSIFKDLKDMFKTESGQPFLFTGTGTGAWETAFVNTLNPGDKVVMFRYGMFSHLWVDMAQRLGLDVEILDEEWGRGADEARLEKVLEQDKEGKIKAVCVVHNETTTGVTSDIGRVREAMNSSKHNALLMVDSISGFGASDMRVDQWGVDCLIIGSQKALSLPTGLCLVCASAKALKAFETSTMKKVYYDWGDQLRTNGSGNFPYTPSLHLMYGLRETLDIALEEGFDNQIARHARLAEGTRRAVAAWGLKNFCQEPRWYSNSLTVVATPEGIDSNVIVNNAYTRFNLSIGIGLAQVNGKVFRIGHLGDLNEVSLLGAISGVEMSLLQSGVDIQPGSGVGAAVKYFQQTSQVLRGRQKYVIGQTVEQKEKAASL